MFTPNEVRKMFNIKKSLLCISAISCMSLYAAYIEVTNPITIGSTPSVPTETDYNYWKNNNTYVFNTSSNNNYTYWKANNTVTINNGYTLKLITTGYTAGYYLLLKCDNTFTNDGKVIIDNYGTLCIDYENTTTSNPISDSTNNGTINVNNGALALWNSAILNNTGTITLTGSSCCIYAINSSTLNNTGTITLTCSSYISISDSSTLTNTGTITFKDSSYIDIYSSTTLTNKGTIDISNITDLSSWINNGTFKLEEGSTFILPKSILEDSKKINTSRWKKPITLNGTKDNPVNIVIPEDCKYITDIDNNNKDALFSIIQEETGFTFDDDNRDYVEFIMRDKM